jgi:hypothetical protein
LFVGQAVAVQVSGKIEFSFNEVEGGKVILFTEGSHDGARDRGAEVIKFAAGGEACGCKSHLCWERGRTEQFEEGSGFGKFGLDEFSELGAVKADGGSKERSMPGDDFNSTFSCKIGYVRRNCSTAWPESIALGKLKLEVLLGALSFEFRKRCKSIFWRARNAEVIDDGKTQGVAYERGFEEGLYGARKANRRK